jgi:autotransporter-associated beta strand protein
MSPSKTLLTLLLALPSARAADVTWNGSLSNDWANPANWTGGTPSATNRPVFAALGAGNLVTVLTAATAVDGILFNNNAPGNVTVTAAKTAQLTIGNGETVTVTAGDHVLLGTGTTTGTGGQAITLGGTSTWDIATGASLTNQARTTKIGGTSDFNKTGGGLLVIDANNGASGGTQARWNAQAGTLRFVAQVGATDALGNSSNPINVSTGATVEMINGASTQRGVVTLNGMGVGGQGAYLLSSGTGPSHSNLTDVAGKTILASDAAIGVASGATLTMTRPIEETGGVRSLTKVGAGTLAIANANTYTGSTLVNAGTLAMSAGGTLASPTVTVATGATFDVLAVAPFTLPSGLALGGTGTVTGTTINNTGARIQPGGASTVGNLTFQNDLELAGSGSVEFDFAGPASADKVIVTGNLSTTGTTPIVTASQPPGGLTTGASYTLLDVQGSLTGSLANFTLVNKTRSVLALSTVGNDLVLNVTTGVAPQSLVWSGGLGGNTWDVNTTANWNTGAQKFFLQDAVSFTDAGAANNVVNLTESLAPSSLTVNSTAHYQFTGVGGLTGATGLVKSGTGDLTLATTNTYTGPTTLNAGKLILGVAGALPGGEGKGNLTLGGGTLDLAGFSITANNLSGAGAINNTGAAATLTLRQTTDTTFSGLISNTGSPLSLVYASPARLTLSGANNTYSGPTNIGLSGAGTRIGTLRAAATQALGTSIVTIGPGGNDATATLELAGGISLNNDIQLSARTNPDTAILNVSGNNTLSTTITLRSGGAFWKFQSDAGKLTLAGTPAVTCLNAGSRALVLAGAADIEVSGVIENGITGSIVRVQKEGTGTATLSGLNIYTGSTTVTAGTLVITNNNVLDDAAALVLPSNSSLNLTHPGTELVGSLVVGGVTYPDGTYTFGTGRIQVGAGGSLYQSWAFANGLTPGLDDGPNQDPENDGLPNLLEYATGAANHPLVEDVNPVTATTVLNASSQRVLRLDFPRVNDPSLTYVVQATNDLAVAFTDAATYPAASAPVQHEDTVALTSGVRRFLRLEVRQN